MDAPGYPARAPAPPPRSGTPRDSAAVPGKSGDAAAAEKKVKSFAMILALGNALFTLVVALILYLVLKN
jgi:hypothetical protein